MTGILEVISSNLLSILIVLSLIFIFQLCNMIFGIINNVIILKQEFSKEKILNWFLRTILTIIGILLLCIGVSLVPFCIEYINITIPDEYNILINFTLIVLTSIQTLKLEATRAYENYKKVMENF